MFNKNVKIFVLQTCGSVNLMSGDDKSPEISCSMYSKTRYMLHDNFEVIIPSSFMTFGWLSLRRIITSRAINRTLSGSKLSNRTFFRATILPPSRSRARKTLLYVPCPTYISKLNNIVISQQTLKKHKCRIESSFHWFFG